MILQLTLPPEVQWWENMTGTFLIHNSLLHDAELAYHPAKQVQLRFEQIKA